MTKREQYESIDALNFSKAKQLLRSPRHFRAVVEPSADKATSLLLGTACHGLLLEGLSVDKSFTIKPSGLSFATKEGKAWKAAQKKPILSYEEAGNVVGMVGAILDNTHARNILSTCILREQIYTGMIDGVACKGLIDAVGSAGDKPAVVEIKTSVDCRADYFGARAVKEPFHYDLQCAWYRTLAKAEISCWIVVENHPPWDVAIYFPGRELELSGEDKMHKALAIYKVCQQVGRWPGSQPDPMILHPPKWYDIRSSLALSIDETKLLQAAEVSPAGS